MRAGVLVQFKKMNQNLKRKRSVGGVKVEKEMQARGRGVEVGYNIVWKTTV